MMGKWRSMQARSNLPQTAPMHFQPGMEAEIILFDLLEARANNSKTAKLLQSMLIPTKLWDALGMSFVTD